MAAPRKSKTAKLILRGGYQHVILPKGFEFKGKAVRIHKQGNAVILEPVITDVEEWFAEIDRHALSGDFMAGGRKQPKAPKRKLFD